MQTGMEGGQTGMTWGDAEESRFPSAWGMVSEMGWWQRGDSKVSGSLEDRGRGYDGHKENWEESCWHRSYQESRQSK